MKKNTEHDSASESGTSLNSRWMRSSNQEKELEPISAAWRFILNQPQTGKP